MRTIRRLLSTRVIGAYESKDSAFAIKDAAIRIQLEKSGFKGKQGEFRILYGAGSSNIAVIGLGNKEKATADTIRSACSTVVRNIKSIDPKVTMDISFEEFGDAMHQAEGAMLAAYEFNGNKSEKNRRFTPTVSFTQEQTLARWNSGIITANAQNLARDLMNTPANLMTPTIFSLKAAELLAKMPNVTVKIHDKSWAEKQSMNAFLSVARGSSEPLQFLEIIYQGSNPLEKPVALVGKGVTFDSGGISIKPSAGMSLMKADMGGAAVVLAALRAIVLKSLPINVVVGIPLTENMPSGSATKPGDVVVARNGVSIEIDNTDAEGRLILADAINYIGETHNPQAVVELSTLTGAMDVALGPGFAGVFTKSDKLWNELNEAGLKAGDPFWRMPMDDVYESLIKSQVADLKNAGPRSAGACTAAIFLQNFAYPNIPYAHIDIAGVMEEKKGVLAGLTGRPVRSIIEYVESLCK